MKEIYRKFGRVVRRENKFLVRVDEHGEAVEESGGFACHPIATWRDLPDVDAEAVKQMAIAIETLVQPPLLLERLIISDGVALHELGDRSWNERTRRVHVSIARAPHRALIDLADFSLGAIQRAANALAKVGMERDTRRVRTAPNVGAALLPALLGVIPMQQWAAPHDGKGEWIANVPAEGQPPNWFRPSYRTRPVRSWFHLRADPFGEVDPDLPQAVALLAPVHGGSASLLCATADAAFPVALELRRIAAVLPDAGWYPYAAGCFGAEIML